MTDNTLKITFGEADDHRDAARERLRRAKAGNTGEAIEQDVRFILEGVIELFTHLSSTLRNGV
jgi:hypothetical protein